MPLDEHFISRFLADFDKVTAVQAKIPIRIGSSSLPIKGLQFAAKELGLDDQAGSFTIKSRDSAVFIVGPVPTKERQAEDYAFRGAVDGLDSVAGSLVWVDTLAASTPSSMY